MCANTTEQESDSNMKLNIERLREILVDEVEESARAQSTALYEEVIEALNTRALPVERPLLPLTPMTPAKQREAFLDALRGVSK